MAMFMPSEFVAQVTGHDMRVVSALFEYLESMLAVLMPGIALHHPTNVTFMHVCLAKGACFLQHKFLSLDGLSLRLVSA